MKMKNKYIYFVSYVFEKHNRTGHGNCELGSVEPLTNHSDFLTIQTELNKITGNAFTTVLFYQLLREEEGEEKIKLD